jgi:hypothetical protein
MRLRVARSPNRLRASILNDRGYPQDVQGRAAAAEPSRKPRFN